MFLRNSFFLTSFPTSFIFLLTCFHGSLTSLLIFSRSFSFFTPGITLIDTAKLTVYLARSSAEGVEQPLPEIKLLLNTLVMLVLILDTVLKARTFAGRAEAKMRITGLLFAVAYTREVRSFVLLSDTIRPTVMMTVLIVTIVVISI